VVDSGGRSPDCGRSSSRSSSSHSRGLLGTMDSPGVD
jgi:hypothetical protein